MSIKSKVIAAAAALTLIGGLGTAGVLGAGTASAATPSCGSACTDVFSHNFGTPTDPQFVLDVFQRGQKVGQPVILFRESNADPAEDWTSSFQGTVADFYAAGMVSAGFALHYGCNGTIPVAGVQIPCAGGPGRDLFAFEEEYAPFGVESGLCAGATSGAVNTKVTLQPCGTNAGTVWAVDTLDSCPTNPLYTLEAQVINGLDTNFSQPSVLTYPADGYPTDKPRPELYLSALAGFSLDGNPPSGPQTCGGLAVNGPDNNQLFGAFQGILP